ncbi:SpoIVB peptidase S55 [Occallatibacter riparius]|uniref:SpoIVB peptidase S55 n=1 Tax=Occallatibacter riparius TaxID=1002689 RepID=A0A9J7BIG9_9BACT|nr:SpoIVB peptidase S55 [Occallatibacter riparius]UWZ82732.1 SpoIVB peptidase S55 [Occallatibacter riparius]
MKDIRLPLILAAAVLAGTALPGTLLSQSANLAATSAAGPPPSTGGFFPLSEVHRGLMATAWTVFTGTKPEPMQVEILGVLKGARGPGHDMILAQLHGTKPEYTGVVAGMSGSPVYVGDKLLGSLSYRIGQFSKDPIAGITPIAQMLEVRDIPVGEQTRVAELQRKKDTGPMGEEPAFLPMETPLVMSGFHPEAIKLWQQKMEGTGLETVAAGGGGTSKSDKISAAAAASIVPGSAVSALLVGGDLEIAATCTVTYVDLKQLLACGHPLQQAGPVSLPMTATEVVATLASPLNAFKIVNTGERIGAFTEDRDAAIRGVLGATAQTIPVHIAVHSGKKTRNLNIEVLDLPSLTSQAVLVSMYEVLLQTNESGADNSYHVTGTIDVDGYPASPVDVWAGGSEGLPPQLAAALLSADRFQKLYTNGARLGAIRGVNLKVEAIPHRASVELASARFTSGNIVHPGDTVTVEATLRPWQQPEKNVRISFKVPARLQGGNVRVLVSDAGTLDRTLSQPKMIPRPSDMQTALAEARNQHPQDRVYVSLLVPETQAGMQGQTLSSVPISMANALEPMRAAQDVSLNGESAQVAAAAAAGGVLSGFQVLNLRIEPGGGVD